MYQGQSLSKYTIKIHVTNICFMKASTVCIVYTYTINRSNAMVRIHFIHNLQAHAVQLCNEALACLFVWDGFFVRSHQ